MVVIALSSAPARALCFGWCRSSASERCKASSVPIPMSAHRGLFCKDLQQEPRCGDLWRTRKGGSRRPGYRPTGPGSETMGEVRPSRVPVELSQADRGRSTWSPQRTKIADSRARRFPGQQFDGGEHFEKFRFGHVPFVPECANAFTHAAHMRGFHPFFMLVDNRAGVLLIISNRPLRIR